MCVGEVDGRVGGGLVLFDRVDECGRALLVDRGVARGVGPGPDECAHIHSSSAMDDSADLKVFELSFCIAL